MSRPHPYQSNQNSWGWKPSISCFWRTPGGPNDQQILGTTALGVIGLFRFPLCSILVTFILVRNCPFKFSKLWSVSCVCYSLIIFSVYLVSMVMFPFYSCMVLLLLFSLNEACKWFFYFAALLRKSSSILFFWLKYFPFCNLFMSAYIFNSLFNLSWVVLLFFRSYGKVIFPFVLSIAFYGLSFFLLLFCLIHSLLSSFSGSSENLITFYFFLLIYLPKMKQYSNFFLGQWHDQLL